MSKTKAVVIHAALMVIVTGTCAYSADQTIWLEKRVCRFIFHGGNPHASTHNPGVGPIGIGLAAHDLAQHAEIPICIESLPAISLETSDTIAPIEIDASDTSIKEILDEIIAQDPRYEYRERLGVIEVLPVGADRDPDNCLNMVIPVFRARYGWNTLIQQLRCEVDIVSRDPKAVVPDPGCGGSYLGIPGLPRKLIETNFENRTVRDILTMLCAKVGNMAWEARFEGPRATCEDISFETYQPRTSYPSDTLPLTWSEGLPKNCITCHYHKPCRSK